MLAYRLKAYLAAGLVLVGYDPEERDYMWSGTEDRWGRAEHAIMIFEHDDERTTPPF